MAGLVFFFFCSSLAVVSSVPAVQCWCSSKESSTGSSLGVSRGVRGSPRARGVASLGCVEVIGAPPSSGTGLRSEEMGREAFWFRVPVALAGVPDRKSVV